MEVPTVSPDRVMRVVKALLPKERLTRAVAISVTGTTLAQAITIAAAPLLTRLYTAEDFGLLGVFTALLGTLGTIICLRYELAIPLANDDRSSINLMALGLTITLLLCSLIALIIWFWGDPIIQYMNAENLGPFLWLLPIGLLALGCVRILTHWAIRHQAFGRITRTRISQSLGQITTQLGFGWFGFGPLGLLVGQIIGQSAGITTLAFSFFQKERQPWRVLRFRHMVSAGLRFSYLASYGSGGALLNVAGRLLPALLFAVTYNAAVAGWFVLAQRILATPVFFSTAVAQVYLGEAPRLIKTDSGGLYSLFLKTAWRLLAFGVLVLAPILVAGPQLFGLIFGTPWTSAGGFAQVMVFMFIGQLAVNPIAQTLVVLERQDIQAAWDALRFVALLLVFLLAGWLDWPPFITVVVLSAVMTICYILLFWITRHVLLASINASGRALRSKTTSLDMEK